MATEHRPVPLPGRGAQPPSRPANRPLPPGAAAWATSTYLNADGEPTKTQTPVPVDTNGYRTDHIRHACTDRRDIITDGVRHPCGQEVWLPPSTDPPFCPLHGARLEPADTTPRGPILPWAAIGKAVEPAARPWWVLLAAAAAGLGVHAGGVPAWWLLPAGPVFAGGAYLGVRWKLTHRAVNDGQVEKRQRSGRRVRTIRRRARVGAYLGATAGLWLEVPALVDPSTPTGVAVLGGTLAGTWALAAGTWWRYQDQFRNRPTPALPPRPNPEDPRPPTSDELAATDAARTWAHEVGIANTMLDPARWKRIKGGWQAPIVATKRGALNGLGGDAIAATVKRVAAGFDVARAAVGWIDEYEGSPNAALLLVQPDSPLKDNITWRPPGVLPADGALLHMGMRIDGTDLRTRLWTPGWGAPSRWIVGTKGSGKTEFLRLLLLGMLEAHVVAEHGPRRLVAPFLHDPKRGKDFGAFRRQVAGFSTTPQMLHLIVEAIAREMDRRYDSLGSDVWFDELGRPREGETAFDPSVHGPIISLIVDEFHDPAKDPTLMAKLDPMGRKMRAAGIEITAASHMSTISDTGSQVFRDMLAGGETWLFRTTSSLNAALATGGQLCGDPRGLPREPGSVLVASGDEATMQARTAFVQSEPLYNRLYDEQNRSRILPVRWPPETLEAFGRDFVQWMRECAGRQPGDPAPAAPKPVQVAGGTGPSIGADDSRAADGLLTILFAAPGPMKRKDIADHPQWRWGVTSMLTKSLNAAQAAGLVVKFGAGPATTFELAPAAREQLHANRDEEADQRAEGLR